MRPGNAKSRKPRFDSDKTLILRRGIRILRRLLLRIPRAGLNRLMITPNEVEYLLELCRLAIEEGWSYETPRQTRTKLRERASHSRRGTRKHSSAAHNLKTTP